ncbi:hypothetical protein CONPUDRAFT_168152 [Coniophora puteana RWD-64-598 SS2]|uniref:DUF4048 domain-containing protein n=1 Tax=Coniophora puteana (strain RWD-64-598) TaxID=741705 RepID=A0A5M3MEX5_CONPW|nr:uncharacterized protein CONPUDRAFT_168152 [Coniophora puteana RWD-64-598 SS2]EIW77155.1 hypothetical protein CONPUDRAFT_168152 [Coniophora puteana RWD-64-598 SS2]
MSPAALNASNDSPSPTKLKTKSPKPRQLQLLDSNYSPNPSTYSQVEKSQRRHSSIAYKTSSPVPQESDVSPSVNASPSLRAERRQSSITYISSRDVNGVVSPSPPSSFNTRRPQSYSHAPRDSRRQSSISYIAPGENSPESPLGRPGYKRGMSESGNGVFELERASGQGESTSKRQSLSSVASGASRGPLTLTEQHADLLRSIAQHESRRMELKGQLETCEADLGKLKRQWERIVQRGISPNSTFHNPSPADTSGAVLGGIREGVQEVGRMLAMGLADLSSPAMPITPRHATRESDSSASSAETAFSTFGFNDGRGSSEWGEELSPKDGQFKPSPQIPVENLPAKVTRRRSVKGSGDLTSRSGQHAASSSTSSAIDPSIRVPASPVLSSAVPEPDETHPSAKPEGLHIDTASPKSKRNSLAMSGLPPPSPMPGLNSLTVVGSSTPMSSWAGSIGKRWGELTNGGSSKHGQKRGSSLFSDVLFSDVSQSLANAFGPASPSPATQLAIPGARTGTSSSSRSHGHSHSKTMPSPAPSSRSFLDDDDDEGQALNVGSVLIPDSAPSVKSRSSGPKTVTPNAETDFDDDWNW